MVFSPRLGDMCVCQNPIGVHVCHFLGKVLGLVHIPFLRMVKSKFLAHFPVDHLDYYYYYY